MAHKESTSNKHMLDKRLFGKHNQNQMRSHGYGGVNFWHWYEFWNSIKDQREATDTLEYDISPSPQMNLTSPYKYNWVLHGLLLLGLALDISHKLFLMTSMLNTTYQCPETAQIIMQQNAHSVGKSI